MATLKPAATPASPVPTKTNTIVGYNANTGAKVYVSPGYTRGVSATPVTPKTTSTKVATGSTSPTGGTSGQSSSASAILKPATTTPETPTTPTTPSGPKTPDQLAAEAQANLAKTPEPQSASQIYQTKYQQSQALIDAINAQFNAAVSGQQELGRQNLQQSNAEAAARGLTGSAEAYASEARTAGKNQQDINAINAQRTVALAEVLKDIQTRSDAELKSQQDMYRQSQLDVISGASTIAGTAATEAGTAATYAGIESTKMATEGQKIANQNAYKENFDQLAGLAHTQWSEYQKQNPQGAADLLAKTGMNEVDAAFRWNASKKATEQIQWGKTPQDSATGYVFTGIDPMTGKIVTQNIDVPKSDEWTFSPATLYQESTMYNKNTGQMMTYAQYMAQTPQNINKLAPDGIVGGECGVFTHTIVDGVPSMGDTLASKQQMINNAVKSGAGSLAANWKPRVGDVIIQNYGKTGHAAVVMAVNGDNITIKQSNKNLDHKVTSETISAKDKSIYGAYTKGSIKGSVADGSKTQREIQLDLKYQKEMASLKRTQQLTESSEVMMGSRRNTIVKSVITNLFGSATKNPAAIYANSAQSINRINPALKEALDKGTIAKQVPDIDLIDAYVQVARGGGQVTEAQVEALRQLGIKGQYDVATQKWSGFSGLLDDASRKELAKMTHAIYDEQGKSAQSAVKQVNAQLTKQGIPSQYLLNKPEDLTVSSNIPSLTPEQLTQFQSQLQPGEVLATDESGNIVAATQEEINSGAYQPYNQ